MNPEPILAHPTPEEVRNLADAFREVAKDFLDSPLANMVLPAEGAD